MRKFGVRALACSLAAALVMTGLATPSVAKAEDILLIAPAPESVKTLYITADMVDCDGEIVISGESWDRIVVSKEAESKDIYFDQVNVKELVVESGSSSNIQLWEVKADTVTVKEPELSELSVKELSSLLADPATQHMALELFIKSIEEKQKFQQKAPSVVTMADAQIGEVVAHGNVMLDFAQGEVGNLVVKASEKQQRVDVTVKNYSGEISYKGGETRNITTLKLVDSRVKALKVDESAANNYLNVNNKDSVAMKVEVAGNAQVSLNIPMGELAVTEAATAAQISLLNVVDEMNISASGAKIHVSPLASIADSTVEGDNVRITGSGHLAAVDITGKGAYVSTKGTKVEGENTYVEPVYVEKPYDSWSENFASADVNANLNQAMNGGKFTYNEEGYGVASSAKGWEGFSVTLDNKDNGSAASFVIKMKVKKLDGTATQVRMTTPPGCSASYMDVVDLNGQWQTITSNKISVPGGGTVNVMVAPTDNSHTLELAVDDVVVERYTEWTAPAARPVVTENKTLTFTNSALSDYKSYNVPVSYSADENGTLTLKTNGAYQAVVFTLPETLNAADYSKLKVYAAASTGEIAVKVWRVGEAGDNGNPATVNYSAISNPVIDLSGIYGDDIEKIEIAAMSGDSCTIVVSKLIFAASGGSGEFGDEDAPVIPEEPEVPELPEEPEVTPEENVDAFYYENFAADYATGFENGGWDVTKGIANYKVAGFNVVEDAANAYEGSYFVKVKMNDVYNGITYTLDNTEGTAEATYTFSAYLKGTGVAGEEFVRMGVGNTYTDTSYWTATDAWTKIEKEVVVPAGESKALVFSAQDPAYCEAADNQMACVFLDKVVIDKKVAAYYQENFSADYATGFEYGAWDVTKGLANYKLAGFSVAEDSEKAGNYYAKVKMNDVYNGINYTLDNTAGTTEVTYTFSAYLKATGVAGEEFVRMGVDNSYTDTSYWTATDAWTKVTKEVKVAAGASKVLVFSAQDPQYCEAADNQMASVYIDDVMITME